MPYPDVWTTIVAMASATTRLKFSTAVYVLPLRHPIEVAKATGTVARLSSGRLILGAGIGWMREEFDVFGVDFETRGRRTDECVEVLRKLWAGGCVEHHGEFFDFPELAITPAPEDPVPIYFGGSSRPALRRAARLGQGWIGAGNSIDEVSTLLDDLRSLRSEYGREEESFEVICPIMEIDQIDRLRELEAQGLSSICFGFGENYRLTLDEKRGLMLWFAENVMAKLSP
jgi:probable F420-dependent oxidoreductase